MSSLAKAEAEVGVTGATQDPPARVPMRSWRVGPLSVRWRVRTVLVCVGFATTAVVAAAVSLGMGEFPISPVRVLEVIFGGAGDRGERLVVLELRMPRTAVGLLVGVAFGVAGAITQTISRNPLASPDILGVTAGAGAAAVAVIVLAGAGGAISGTAARVGVPAAALVGGVLTALVVYLLAWRRGASGYRLVLVGIGIGAMLYALIQWLLVLAEVTDAARATVWLVGSLNGRTWDQAAPLAVALLVLLPLMAVVAGPLGALQLGDDVARGLGVRVEAARMALLLLAVLVASVATSAAGPVGFVALVSPQVARLVTRVERPPLVASALVGATLVTVSDVIARTVLAPTQLPVGIVTSVIGAPYLMFLLVRSRREASA